MSVASLIVPSRREFLRLLGLVGLSSVSGVSPSRSRLLAAAPLFEEVPAERQRHQLGARERAVGRPLPARDHGARRGVLRLRQRRLGRHLHGQQRRERFLQAGEAAQERAVQEQPRRHVHRRDRRRRVSQAARSSGWAAPSRDYDNDGYPDILVTAYGRCTLYHNNGNGTFTDVTDKVGRRRARLDDERGLVRLRQRRQAGSVPVQLRRSSRLPSNVFCGDNKLGKRFYCIPRVFKPTPSLLFHNNGDGTFTRGERRHGHPAGDGQGARRRRDRHQRRRPDGPVRRQRYGPEFPVREPRQGQVGRDRAGGRSRLQRQRHAALGDGRRRRRHQRRRQAGSVRRQRRPGDVLALQERRQRVLLRCRRRRTASRRRRAC